jgi:hypothetical protein
MPFTNADLKPVVPVVQRLLFLLQDPDTVGDALRNETQHLQILIEYGPDVCHIEEQDGSPYAQDGTSRSTRDSHNCKKIDAPELARDLRRVLDDILAIDANHLERGRRRERIETVALLKEFRDIVDVRPDTPDADYCVLEGAIRWESRVPAAPRSCDLLGKLLDSPRPVSTRVIRGKWSPKTLHNEVSKLRKLLGLINFPKKIKWGNEVLSLV